jgi:hypothetical protein
MVSPHTLSDVAPNLSPEQSSMLEPFLPFGTLPHNTDITALDQSFTTRLCLGEI